MAKTFLQILTKVKQEARVKSSDDLDDWIKSVINELYLDYCENNEYPELLVPFASLQITADAQSEFTLPVDVRNIVSIEYAHDSSLPAWRALNKRNAYTLSYTQGSPMWYFQAGNKVYIFPASLVSTNALLRLAYYKRPPELVADTDQMLVPTLEPVVHKEAVARVLRYHSDDRKASEYVSDATRSFVRGVK